MKKTAEETKKPGDEPPPSKSLISALLADNAWFRAMVDSSPMGISIARDGITFYANEACVRMFGYDSAE
ncbi:MAG TPA: PAS domain-containing protein [Deltaproteobacteria bacterium]|nr:PAS domain-containing protein [Deltaproteobacteria bacterium]